MLHYFIGNLGHLFVIGSFVTALITSFAYWRAAGTKNLALQNEWLQNGRVAFILHPLVLELSQPFQALSIITTSNIIAYAHSSLHLPGQYMVSCFWEGQEGSFLLWLFWQAILGLIIMRAKGIWEAP